MKPRNFIILAVGLLLASFTIQAANVKNQYLFVENQIDGEYFVTPLTLDPRFTGANMFTKYASNRQLSLGYMGAFGLMALNSFADIWLEDSPIDRPFVGDRCWRSEKTCPADGYLPGYIGKNGVYHIKVSTWLGEAGFPRGVFSNSAYEYFRNVPVGAVNVYKYHYCYTTKDYVLPPGKVVSRWGERRETINSPSLKRAT
ncbi:hypothetical protein [Serratia sp. UGAL515B_01]|uniref:hypothetical protein n=1 Tax=Serratia sp. UGAL515B_01 TaxID=2986763 RepID=UPI002954B5B1|nr:hypothetical protein [Serratia sp. UGAL515B_01]WON77510.1 hypothetical protein OK023_02025 [Serratia sp. UGAL515B_01]